MLAPTRDLVAQLNQRARTHRLARPPAPAERCELADGNTGQSVGDLSSPAPTTAGSASAATDWVKNGDRWTVLTSTTTAH